jgi:hypothetical protein
MANDLATLLGYLNTALRDTDNSTWGTTEKQNLLTWASASTWPRLASRTEEEVTLADDDSLYTLTTVAAIDRIDVIDEDGKMLHSLPGGTWEFRGDGESVGGELYINPLYAREPHTLLVHGWAPYNLATTLPPDRHVPLILAIARAEACRREIARRAAFKNWMTLEQTQNISVNELVLMVNEADNEAMRLRTMLKTWRRPVPARVG